MRNLESLIIYPRIRLGRKCLEMTLSIYYIFIFIRHSHERLLAGLEKND